MAWKNLTQTSLADAMLIEHESLQELDEVNTLIDWGSIEGKLSSLHNKRKGEKAFPPLMMFKALLLQSWYSLSDPQLEKQLARDLMFRRFVGLGLSVGVPDHSTIWRFRNLLEENGLLSEILHNINEQMAAMGALIKAGEISIIDASVIQAQRNRPNKDKDGNNTQDPEGSYNVKAGSDGKVKTTYGFKAHINVDEDGFVKKTDYSTGSVHDSQCFEGLLTNTERGVYADSAYASAKTSELLRDSGTSNCILERAYRNKPLTKEQKKSNAYKSSIRCTVERVFGVMKLHYGMSKARYLGLVRNRARFHLICIAYNIKRGVSILTSMQLSHVSEENCA